jgi:hypothetical protein
MTAPDTLRPPAPGTATRDPAPSPARLAVGALTALATVPYVALKAAWLAGDPVGFADPAALADPTLTALNAVTLGLDLLVVALAAALTFAWGRRLPAWPVLLPAWVGTGFLVPMLLVVLPAVLAQPLTGGAATGGLAPWVHPVVYGGFAAQGAFLAAALALHARDRWPADGPRGTGDPVGALLTAGGTLTALGAAGLQVASGVAAGGTAVVVQVGTAALGLGGAAGVVALTRGSRAAWVRAVAFTGTAALFSWGLWNTATAALLGANAGLPALGQLAALLAGFALAVAGLLAVAPRRG